MIQISQAEAKAIRQVGLGDGVFRTVRQKSGKRATYFLCEDAKYIKALNNYRNSLKVIK